MDHNAATNVKYEQKLEWIATYADNTALKQYIDGKEHSSEDITRKQLRQFILVDKSGNPRFIHRFKPGQQFIYRARTVMRPGIGVLERIHIVGWKEGRCEQIAFIFENDELIEVGEFVSPNSPESKEKPWYYSVMLKDHDFDLIE